MSVVAKLGFTFSDLISGYVSSPLNDGFFAMQTSDGRIFNVKLTDTTYAELVRNLGEPWQDPNASLLELLCPGQFVFAYGIFYPENDDLTFEVKHLLFVGRGADQWRFEEPTWWITMVRRVADFYLAAQFPDGIVDFSQYRTHVTVEGRKIDSTRQEADTISRVVYGFATTYLLTGDDRYLEAAEKGTEYLREHFCAVDEQQDINYWYHAIDVRGGRERKVLASEFGDDYDAIPAYEQIYALAGPMQTYRVTNDPKILRDAERTVNLFDKYFLDREHGGYFSHIDPITMDPRSPTLGHNMGRKNWNSVGDHAPAYLINLVLATGDERYRDMLVQTADTIEAHFPDYENSPFVNEKFFEDWSHDHDTPLQKNRAIVGHNFKIAWNLTRVRNLLGTDRYEALCRKIAEQMSLWGIDHQRGGCYDMVERQRQPGEEFHRLVWHDRKAWWQQEQAILCYLIMAGSYHDDQYRKWARETAAYYAAWFPDNDSGGVYFNVLASGVPYLLGTERLKGSHSMSAYHSTELCYLAAVYTNLLLTRQPMDFYFKPRIGGPKDNILRVAPDLLPPGSVRLEAVWIDGEPYLDFDAESLTVRLPWLGQTADQPMTGRPPWMRDVRVPAGASAAAKKTSFDVRVRIVPAELAYDIDLELHDGIAVIELEGQFDDRAALPLKQVLDRVVAARVRQLVLDMHGVGTFSAACGRAVAFARKALSIETDIGLVGAGEHVTRVFRDLNVLEELSVNNGLA